MIIAGVLLVAALIFPIYILILDYNETFLDLVQRGPLPLQDQTDIQSFFQSITLRHEIYFTILGIGEVILVILFLLTLRALLKTTVTEPVPLNPT
jgi:hypothetical protein